MRLLLLPVFAVTLVAGCLSSAAETTGTLRGVIRDPGGAIIPDAVVFVHRWKLNDHSLNRAVSVMEAVVRTDSHGQFSVRLAPDVYEVFVAYPAFGPCSKRVRIEPGKEVALECELSFDDLTKWIE